jgi:hypothetical protein
MKKEKSTKELQTERGTGDSSYKHERDFPGYLRKIMQRNKTGVKKKQAKS